MTITDTPAAQLRPDDAARPGPGLGLSHALRYVDVPQRGLDALDGFMVGERPDIDQAVARFAHVGTRPADRDGDVEVLHGVALTHRFVDAPADSETRTWHYVEAGSGEPVVFLHGIPDSWYQWHHQLAALAATHRVIAVDLKGYGQSDKRPGDYRHAGVAEQLNAIGVYRFNLVTHDRGSVPGDYLAAAHPHRVLRYLRGEQHLYHFNPVLAPQEKIFSRPDMMHDPARFVVWGYGWATKHQVPDADIERTIQEYSYPGIAAAVPRYFTSSSFRQEWIDRRTRLLAAWTMPVAILQGYDSRTQPRELYTAARNYIPNAPRVDVRYLDAGHFWTLEGPDEATEAIRDLLTV